MNKEERVKKIKERYDKAKESGDLNRRSSRSSNPLEAFDRELAETTLKEQMKDGKTVVPIDLQEFWKNCGNSMDFAHAKDKVIRYFEILMLNQLYPDDMQKLRGIYGSETTAILRNHFTRGKHFIVEANAEKEIAFLTIDISDLQNETAE